MAITPSMRRTAQVGLESQGAIGTPVATTKVFSSFGLTPGVNVGVGTARPAGQTAVTQGWVATEDSTFSVEGGVLNFQELPFILASAVKRRGVAPTVVTTNGQQRVYSISQTAADASEAYTVEVGARGTDFRWMRASGVQFNAFSFEAASGDETASMGGSAIGGALDYPAGDMPATATGTDYVPAIPKQATIKYSTTSWTHLLASGTTIPHAFRVNFELSDRRAIYRFLGDPTGGIGGTVETVPGINFDLQLADEDAPIDTFLTRVRAGQKIWFQVKFEGPPIDPAQPAQAKYTIQMDICCVLRDGFSLDDVQEVQAVNFPFAAAYDSARPGIVEFTIINNDSTSTI